MYGKLGKWNVWNKSTFISKNSFSPCILKVCFIDLFLTFDSTMKGIRNWFKMVPYWNKVHNLELSELIISISIFILVVLSTFSFLLDHPYCNIPKGVVKMIVMFGCLGKAIFSICPIKFYQRNICLTLY